MDNRKWNGKAKDVFLVIVYLMLLFKDLPLFSASAMIEHFILITLGFVGVIEVAYAIGWVIIVPSFYEYYINKKQREVVQICIKKYFNEEIVFMKEYSEERIQYILAQMGITKKQFDKLQYDLIKMRGIEVKNENDAKEKIEYTLKSNYPIIIKQNGIPAQNRSYDFVKYFINYNIFAFDKKNLRELASILAFIIRKKSNIKEIDKIVIPYDSNFLLGLEVGNILNLPLVKMREKYGRIEKDKPWDGYLKEGDKVIIVHDVLVTGKQIEEAIDKLPQTCEKNGMYCLVCRKEYNGREVIEKKGVAVYSVIELDDDDIEEIRRE